MTKVKLCGLSRESDIAAVNKLKPDLVGFVFAKKSKRYVSPEQAEHLKSLLAPGILAAGVFVNEPVEAVAELLDRGVIDVAQLHGSEDDDYIARLRALTGKPIFRAFKVKSEADLPTIENCAADLVLLDSGAGTGKTFDWSLVQSVQRPYDSFSYNLYQLVGAIDPDIRVVRNDELSIEEIDALHPARIILSPGPGRPEDAGVLIDVVKTLSPRIPTLGVCLGHQAICAAFGATVTYANCRSKGS